MKNLYFEQWKKAHAEEIKQRFELETQINAKKKLLNKYREDVEQVDLFGMSREDYESKKVLCIQLVTELRVLEKQLVQTIGQ